MKESIVCNLKVKCGLRPHNIIIECQIGVEIVLFFKLKYF